jgi:hypothetical protein
MLILNESVGGVYSNIPLKPEFRLDDLSRGKGHCCIDLGDDTFTKGRPHPMISPETRNRYILNEAEEPEVAALLLDVVLGYGAHRDMAGALAERIKAARLKAEVKGRYLAVVTSVCGTAMDPQDFASQVKKLRDVGAVVMPSNAQAARFAALISRRGLNGVPQRGGIWEGRPFLPRKSPFLAKSLRWSTSASSLFMKISRVRT